MQPPAQGPCQADGRDGAVKVIVDGVVEASRREAQAVQVRCRPGGACPLSQGGRPEPMLGA
eukprot:11177280-Lingulodinium_polyedra.AAC.1